MRMAGEGTDETTDSDESSMNRDKPEVEDGDDDDKLGDSEHSLQTRISSPNLTSGAPMDCRVSAFRGGISC